MLSPGETQTKTFELKPGVQAVGVVVLYRDIDNAQWRADAPAATSGPTKLTLNVGKLAITLKPRLTPARGSMPMGETDR